MPPESSINGDDDADRGLATIDAKIAAQIAVARERRFTAFS